MTHPVLELRGLRTEFRIGGAWHAAVRDVSLAVAPNETLAVVGESGSGKSVTALSVLRLLPGTGARHGGGQILLEGRDLAALPEKQMMRLRGDAIAMIFQEPMTSLNPTMTVGDQIAEAIRQHRGLSWAEARKLALQALQEVKIPAAGKRFDDYPHQFSGGMRQRVMIAMALACKPRVLLADEPTTALDVTIQAQILTLLSELKSAHGMAVVFITHNLGVVAQIADRVAVMYAGEVVETAGVQTLFERPLHPYTEALLKAMPRVDADSQSLASIPGSVPAITAMPPGCAFAPRCPLRQPRCETQRPRLETVAPAHEVRCVVRAEAVRT
ncbi:ABC transporter ATP-binding protein [Bordetella hinzii]|uniref:ABC transporter ATP-binding protein n=1 Tax=Bordetella hinzii TaxID=103855 RepID=A0AAN1RXM6_9BORD|nr:ABC transporter ATP-binding protein [Bordetella hinzii]AKQ56951.1 Oligopeptide transport ATP-binding protein OppD [Bordetella hinzii]AKQ61417.1 Oligopeptide transport ATP-binding protein OppD [Bordetella hinzii]AZW17610.1 ABC transporter ATP-binding protein [Bordetella hinzii]KCB30159.1 oligopeptide/dipeptide transporter, C-terminal domain protein [Bordetella hinzii L60]KCB34130.1 oligopeptide/dipeptide transporter, C-terminal domain protein [Bordetella hinzii CA90 BAL1384]